MDKAQLYRVQKRAGEVVKSRELRRLLPPRKSPDAAFLPSITTAAPNQGCHPRAPFVRRWNFHNEDVAYHAAADEECYGVVQKLDHGPPGPLSIAASPSVVCHTPRALSASRAPGHGGVVTMRTQSGLSPVLRNWNAVRGGMVRLVPAHADSVFGFSVLAPDLSLSAHDIPDLFYQAMRSCPRVGCNGTSRHHSSSAAT